MRLYCAAQPYSDARIDAVLVRHKRLHVLSSQPGVSKSPPCLWCTGKEPVNWQLAERSSAMQADVELSDAQEAALVEIHNVVAAEMTVLQKARRNLTRQIQVHVCACGHTCKVGTLQAGRAAALQQVVSRRACCTPSCFS